MGRCKSCEVIKHFINGVAVQNYTETLTSTKDGRLLTYLTCIAQKSKGKIIINPTSYSVTSSKHFGMLLSRLEPKDILLITDYVPRGTIYLENFKTIKDPYEVVKQLNKRFKWYK